MDRLGSWAERSMDMMQGTTQNMSVVPIFSGLLLLNLFMLV